MPKTAIASCILFLSGVLLAQQPSPMGKAGDSGKNYRSPDGTLLSKNSSDEELARSLNESFGNHPEFANVQVAVRHHKATLSGMVDSKDAKSRAENLAENTVGIRYVRNRLKLPNSRPKEATSMMSASSH